MKYSAGKFVVPQDFDEKDYNPDEHFSDQPISFNSFLPLLKALLGKKIKLRLEGLNVTREQKILDLLLVGWLRFNSSCYANALSFQGPNYSEKYNMCCNCWKCKIDVPIYQKLKLL